MLCGEGAYISLANDGKAPLKVRPSSDRGKKDVETLQLARKKVIEFAKSLEVVGKTGYKAMTVERYETAHAGRHPHEDGLTTVTRNFEGKEYQVVLIRKAPEGEWDVVPVC